MTYNILQNKNLLFLGRNIINITFFISFLISIITKKPFYVILTILITISEISNIIFKFICKKIMGKKTYKIIGTGERPKKMKNNSYGMPSGHSQFAGAVSTYIILHNYKNKFIVISSIMWMLYIMYSRVYEKFHTVQQTIVGCFIGCILGYYVYEYYIFYY
jgi:membrane-associated phospholipid phosphatase